VLRDGDQCFYAEESAISPLWKGRRFSMNACISGWVILNSEPVVIDNVYDDPRIPIDVYRPTFVKSLAMVPIRRSAPIGAIGTYWAKERMPTPEELVVLQILADTSSITIENARLILELEVNVRMLKEIHDKYSAA
jgi:two-component system CheB/CheR fusion protein